MERPALKCHYCKFEIKRNKEIQINRFRFAHPKCHADWLKIQRQLNSTDPVNDWTKSTKDDFVKHPLGTIKIRQGKKIQYKGLSRTILQWSLYLKIPENTIRQRIKRGLSLDLVFSTKRIIPAVMPRRKSKLYFYDGLSLTIQQWAQRLQIDPNTLRMRLKSKAPPERIFTSKKWPR